MKVNIDWPNGGPHTVVKIEDIDLWNLDVALAHIIAPALVAFKAKLNGYPAKFEKEFPEDGEGAEKAWAATIDKMIRAFEAVRDDNYFGHNEDVQEGLELFGIHYRDLWD